MSWIFGFKIVFLMGVKGESPYSWTFNVPLGALKVEWVHFAIAKLKSSAIVCFLRCRISPMSFAILRIQKLKSFADVGGSLSHNYRNRETLNADDARTHLNEHALIPTKMYDRYSWSYSWKRRKDAVLCIEHLITASPEWDGWGTEKKPHFLSSRKWLENKYGKNNVVSTTIHRDETTLTLSPTLFQWTKKRGDWMLKIYRWISTYTFTNADWFCSWSKRFRTRSRDPREQGKTYVYSRILWKLNNYENEPGIEKGLTYEVPEPEFLNLKIPTVRESQTLWLIRYLIKLRHDLTERMHWLVKRKN